MARSMAGLVSGSKEVKYCFQGIQIQRGFGWILYGFFTGLQPANTILVVMVPHQISSVISLCTGPVN